MPNGIETAFERIDIEIPELGRNLRYQAVIELLLRQRKSVHGSHGADHNGVGRYGLSRFDGYAGGAYRIQMRINRAYGIH